MIDPKTAPDPQIGSNPELLALCQEHIDEAGALRRRTTELVDRVVRLKCTLRSIERQLQDTARTLEGVEFGYFTNRLHDLAEEARNATTD